VVKFLKIKKHLPAYYITWVLGRKRTQTLSWHDVLRGHQHPCVIPWGIGSPQGCTGNYSDGLEPVLFSTAVVVDRDTCFSLPSSF
jgi:hypothetical protein